MPGYCALEAARAALRAGRVEALLLPRCARELHQAANDQVQTAHEDRVDVIDDAIGDGDLEMRERLARFAERDVELRLLVSTAAAARLGDVRRHRLARTPELVRVV